MRGDDQHSIIGPHPEEPMTSVDRALRPRFQARIVTFAIALALLVVAAGCKDGAMEIQKLVDDPGLYDGTIVRVAGKVTTSIGLLGYGAYRLDDGTGSVLVVSKRGAPREGAKVGVEGTFRSVFTFQEQSGTAIEETDRYEP
jgi:hypothetical protein